MRLWGICTAVEEIVNTSLDCGCWYISTQWKFLITVSYWLMGVKYKKWFYIYVSVFSAMQVHHCGSFASCSSLEQTYLLHLSHVGIYQESAKNRNICKLKMLHAESEMRSCQKKMKLIVCSFFVNSLVALWWVSIISNSTHKAWGMKENFCDEWMNPYFVLLMLYGAVSMDGRDIRVIGLLLRPPL